MFKLPEWDALVEQAGGVATNGAVLLIGVAIGLTWMAMEVQATGCVTKFGITGACSVLPSMERWAMRAVGVAVVLFVGAFAAEYYQQEVSE